MSSVPSLDSLETPALLVDVDRMHRNLDRMAAYTRDHGLRLRPHVKTHKSPVIAVEQVARGASGLTCATTMEADVMQAASGDLLVMYPPVGAMRLERLFALDAGTRLIVALDSAEALRGAAEMARTYGRTLRVLIEVDAGMRRTGVTTAEEAIRLARAAREAGAPVEYAGIAFYPGHIRDPLAEQGEKLRATSKQLEGIVQALDRAGLAPDIVSGGSTPAAWRMHELRLVTEVRPGTYVFNDRATADLGACDWDDCALTVLATVVSTAVPGQAVIDAGTKALGREPLRAGSDDGYACLEHDRRTVVRAMSEEHGIVDLRETGWRPRVGDRVRLIPNHVCIAVHLSDLLILTRNDVVQEVLPVAARGRHAPGTIAAAG